MKKTNSTFSRFLIILSLFFYFTKIAQAQIKIGPKFGMTFSKIHQSLGEDEFNYHDRSDKFDKKNLTVGISTQLKLKEKWFLQADFFYALKGANTVDFTGGDSQQYKIESKSIDSNLQISYQPFKYTFFEIGPYYSYALAVTAFEYGGWGGDYFTSDYLELPFFDRYDFGMTAGFSLQHWNMVLGLKYFYGIKEVSYKQRNRMLQLTMGYYFVL